MSEKPQPEPKPKRWGSPTVDAVIYVTASLVVLFMLFFLLSLPYTSLSIAVYIAGLGTLVIFASQLDGVTWVHYGAKWLSQCRGAKWVYSGAKWIWQGAKWVCRIAAPRQRCWYQFYLWHLFVLMTVVAFACAWFRCKMVAAERQKEAVAAIQQLDGVVMYGAKPPGPAWFRNLVGVDFLTDVVVVRLNGPQITDAGLVPLHSLTRIEQLGLSRTQVNDAGLEHLKRLTKLEVLWLKDTQVTDDGIEKLRQVLPNCDIGY